MKKDEGKARVDLVLTGFPRALLAISRLSAFGAKKYEPHGWRTVPDGFARYTGAMGRHLLLECMGVNVIDPDSGELEATCVAWNSLARLELLLSAPPEQDAALARGGSWRAMQKTINSAKESAIPTGFEGNTLGFRPILRGGFRPMFKPALRPVYRLVHGGAWYSIARYCRSACHDVDAPDDRLDDVGFRFTMALPPVMVQGRSWLNNYDDGIRDQAQLHKRTSDAGFRAVMS